MKISIGHSPSCLLRLYKAIKEERKLDVTLDFAHSAYVEPVVLLPLTQLCIEGLKRGFKIGYVPPTDKATNQYLEEVGWKDFVEQGYRLPVVFALPTRETTLPMWCVSKDYIYSYLQLTNQYLKRIDSSKDWTGFEMVLKELLNNVYDHASDPGKEPAYVFAQYSNSREKLSLVISDIGIGLANKINLHRENANEAALSTEDAVKKAFESGYSTKSVPTNRGLGLDNVASLVQSTKSVLHCYTGDLHMVVNKDGFCPQKTTFEPMGTLFHMELNTKLLPSEGESDDELSW